MLKTLPLASPAVNAPVSGVGSPLLRWMRSVMPKVTVLAMPRLKSPTGPSGPR